MHISNDISKLPQAFQNIKYINSMSVKSDMALLISELDQLIKKGKTRKPKPELVDLTNRFLDYLVSSCKDRNTISRRATWLLQMGGVVINKHRAFVRHEDDYSHSNYEDVVSLVTTMTEKFGLCAPAFPMDMNDIVLETIGAIVDALGNMNPNQPSYYYATMKNKIELIIERLNHLIKNKSVGVAIDYKSLQIDLYRLYTCMVAYQKKH